LMSDELIDKDGEIELYRVAHFEVYDPWTATQRGWFLDEADARAFMKTLRKKSKKSGK